MSTPVRARWGKLREKRQKKTDSLGLMTEKSRKRGSKVGKIAVFCVKVGSLAAGVRAPAARVSRSAGRPHCARMRGVGGGILNHGWTAMDTKFCWFLGLDGGPRLEGGGWLKRDCFLRGDCSFILHVLGGLGG